MMGQFLAYWSVYVLGWFALYAYSSFRADQLWRQGDALMAKSTRIYQSAVIDAVAALGSKPGNGLRTLASDVIRRQPFFR
jgi:hypothetical protein